MPLLFTSVQVFIYKAQIRKFHKGTINVIYESLKILSESDYQSIEEKINNKGWCFDTLLWPSMDEYSTCKNRLFLYTELKSSTDDLTSLASVPQCASSYGGTSSSSGSSGSSGSNGGSIEYCGDYPCKWPGDSASRFSAIFAVFVSLVFAVLA